MISVAVSRETGSSAAGRALTLSARFSDEIVASLDGCIIKQLEPRPLRSETIRKILEDQLVDEGFIKSGQKLGRRRP